MVTYLFTDLTIAPSATTKTTPVKAPTTYAQITTTNDPPIIIIDPDDCEDVFDKCDSLANVCDNENMKHLCMKSCGACNGKLAISVSTYCSVLYMLHCYVVLWYVVI